MDISRIGVHVERNLLVETSEREKEFALQLRNIYVRDLQSLLPHPCLSNNDDDVVIDLNER